MRFLLTLLFLGCTVVAGAGVDPAGDVLMYWPSPDVRSVGLFHSAGVNAVVVPFDETGNAAPFLGACRDAGIAVLAELDTASPGPELEKRLNRLHAAGFAGAVIGAAGDPDSWKSFLKRKNGLDLFLYLKPEQVEWDVAPAHAVLRYGRWPGIHAPDPTLITATTSYWVDSNLNLFAYLRARFPDRAAVIAYRPDEKAGVSKDRRLPYASVETALVEARALGGNVILSLPDHYRRALLADEPRAVAAWTSFGVTARFLRQNTTWLRSPVASRVAVIASTLENSEEILNLLYRHNATPVVIRPGEISLVRPESYRVLVTPGVTLSRAQRAAALDFVRHGGWLFTVPADETKPGWWQGMAGLALRQKEEERDLYGLGSGSIAAYKESFVDPGEFALDVIEAEGWSSRDLRIWGPGAVIGILHRQSNGTVSVELLNYGSRPRGGFLVRLEQAFQKAIFQQPGAEPVELKVPYRRRGTELDVAGMRSFARIILK